MDNLVGAGGHASVYTSYLPARQTTFLHAGPARTPAALFIPLWLVSGTASPVKTAFNKKRSRLQSLLYKQDVEWELKVYEGKRMALSIAAVVLSLVLSLAYACNLAAAARPDPADGLDRPGYGEADREYLLEVEGLGSDAAKLTVEIPAMQYAGSQIGEIMRQAGDALRNLMLGENPSADEVRTDLILPATVKGTGIQVEWSVEYTDCLDALGHVNNGQCPEEGQLVWLEADIKISGI